MRLVIKFQTQHLFIMSGILFGSSSSVTGLCTWLFCYSQKQVKSSERFSPRNTCWKRHNFYCCIFSILSIQQSACNSAELCVCRYFSYSKLLRTFTEAYNAALKLVSKSHFEKKKHRQLAGYFCAVPWLAQVRRAPYLLLEARFSSACLWSSEPSPT